LYGIAQNKKKNRIKNGVKTPEHNPTTLITYLSSHFLTSKQTNLNKRILSATHTNLIHSKPEP